MSSGRRPKLQVCLFALLAGLLFFASPNPACAQSSKRGETLDTVDRWKIINTAIFVAGLGWFLAKYGPRFFNARSSDIQKAIKDATGLKIEADFRYSVIDKKMASLPQEVEKLRQQGRQEMEREQARFRQQTQAEVERIKIHAGIEIDALRKEAADRVQLHTAQLALGLAERRLQDRFASGEPADLTDDFIRLIERGKN